jgi:hypothetical protein
MRASQTEVEAQRARHALEQARLKASRPRAPLGSGK